jgi:alkylation response protein AidB-like acyl-CoA dehydrogenase
VQPGSEEFEAFGSALQMALDRHIDPLIEPFPRDRALPKEVMHEVFAALAELGILGARVPESEGGPGLPHSLLGRAMELMPAFLGIDVVGHESTVKRLSLGGRPEVIERYLAPMIAGELIGGTATSEPDVGSDPRSLATSIEVRGDELVVNGRKLWTTNGSIADVIVVVGRLREEDGTETISRVLIDTREAAVETAEVEAVGLQRGHLSEVVFDDVHVPRDHLLGEAGDAHATLTATWLANRPCLGLIGTGLAARALDASLRYVGEREQFGSPLSRFQITQQKLAAMYRKVESARLLCYRALELLDRGEWPAKETSLAKWVGTEIGVEVTHEAIQLHGSNGLTKEYGIEEMWRDARMLPLPDGTNEIQQLIIGRELTGVRAFRATDS